ncbi:sulfurtransferase TusA family protein [Halarsenatibacter silvermanii]|uniref:TusA-related sulfurtransferase n=1 Tax=Halarsenatibacter silvermanii TaxID=321763 RepID=A0A1G9TFK2_9FIRM|nr:sulfurtransferase TusA family protein [Halarsenatibacter silvermanii]SDM46506.1 TusA-related sulfurtransferase [Halarsenatibacter silvermanii]
MSHKTVDTSGLSCPQPLMMVKEALEESKDEFEAIIDTEVARENITRFLENEDVDFEIEPEGDNYIFHINS